MPSPDAAARHTGAGVARRQAYHERMRDERAREANAKRSQTLRQDGAGLRDMCVSLGVSFSSVTLAALVVHMLMHMCMHICAVYRFFIASGIRTRRCSTRHTKENAKSLERATRARARHLAADCDAKTHATPRSRAGRPLRLQYLPYRGPSRGAGGGIGAMRERKKRATVLTNRHIHDSQWPRAGSAVHVARRKPVAASHHSADRTRSLGIATGSIAPLDAINCSTMPGTARASSRFSTVPREMSLTRPAG